ncbi:MAG: Rne/Rng family ribonuclease [Candidatus Omnitrophica bacterium]|nr:Rne/Rng family ribonuclease [Candidatus Omnitrophota bacterium]
MTKFILINSGTQENRVAMLKDGKLEEFFIERVNKRTIVGNIYKARIDSIATSLNAAFVDIGLGKKGFLYLSQPAFGPEFNDDDVDNLTLAASPQVKKNGRLNVGQEILVQVVKEQFGTKGPRLTTKISLPGRYLVVIPYSNNIGISRRIDEDAERKRLKDLMHSMRLPSDFGFVIRTVSVGTDKRQLHRDVKFLIKLWHRIAQISHRSKTPALIHEEFNLIMRIVRDSFTEDVTNIFIDSKRDFHAIRRFVRIYSPSLLRKVLFYRGKEPLFEKFKIEEKIDEIYERKVNLKSGGYLYIEPTEGLVAVDVNSGRFKGPTAARGVKAQEEMAFKVNMEAADEIARQLRLRDLGGLIVIDFIDMIKDVHRKRVFTHFKQLLKHDRAKTDVIRISEFGILEMTRQKQRLSAEKVSFQICPYCEGRGRVRTVATVAIAVLRMLNKVLKEQKKGKLLISLHPDVVEFLNLQYKDTLKDLQQRFKSSLILNPSPHLHLEKIIIE